MYVSNFGPKSPKNTAKVTACAVTFSVTFGLFMQESLPCVLRQLLCAGLHRVEYRNDKVRDVILGRLGRQLPDALGDALRVEFDKSKRRDIIISMQKIIMDDAAAIIFGYPQTNIISNKSITGAKIQACDYYWLTQDWKPAN